MVDELDAAEGGGGGPCGRSVALGAVLADETSLDEVEAVDEVLPVEDVDEEAPGGGPGGGPPAPSEPESSLPSEPPDVCSCDRIDRKPDIAGLMPVESTLDVPDAGSEVVAVDVEAEEDGSSAAAVVWLDAALLWLCIAWWWECALSETDKGISVGRWFDDASPFGDAPAPAPQTAAGRRSMWDVFPLPDHG